MTFIELEKFRYYFLAYESQYRRLFSMVLLFQGFLKEDGNHLGPQLNFGTSYVMNLTPIEHSEKSYGGLITESHGNTIGYTFTFSKFNKTK